MPQPQAAMWVRMVLRGQTVMCISCALPILKLGHLPCSMAHAQCSNGCRVFASFRIRAMHGWATFHPGIWPWEAGWRCLPWQACWAPQPTTLVSCVLAMQAGNQAEGPRADALPGRTPRTRMRISKNQCVRAVSAPQWSCFCASPARLPVCLCLPECNAAPLCWGICSPFISFCAEICALASLITQPKVCIHLSFVVGVRRRDGRCWWLTLRGKVVHSFVFRAHCQINPPSILIGHLFAFQAKI